MKKLFCLLLVLAMAFAMAVTANAEADLSGYKIGVAMAEISNDGWAINRDGVIDNLDALGVEYLLYDATADVAKQTQQIEDLIAQGVSGIIMVPVDSNAIVNSIEKCNKAGIPVVCMDRGTNGGEIIGVVTSDNVACGAEAAKLMLAAAEKQGVALEDIVCLELLGNQGDSAGLERHTGFYDTATELGMNVVASMNTDWSPDKAYNSVLDGFQAHPDINAIFMASDCAVQSGVLSALKHLDKLVPVGEEGHIIIGSVDGGWEMFESIRKGETDVSAGQKQYEMGRLAVERMIDCLTTGNTEFQNELIAPDNITVDNVDSEDHWINVYHANQQG